MTTIATVDLKKIQEIYEQIKDDYPEYSERFVYFLAACLYLDPEINLEIVLKLRPYGGLIGKDNSSLDTYLKSYKLVREEKIESRGQSILRKQQIICNLLEDETLNKYLSLLEYFQMYHVFTRENEKTETNPFTYAQVANPSSSEPGRRKSP